ncbi:MAG: hypothetical protein ACOCVR_04285 [Myxococcota bacterium]
MRAFWKVLLAFSLSVNLAGAAIVLHHFLTAHDGCPGGCHQQAAMLDDLGGEAKSPPGVQSMRSSFEVYRRGCQCEMNELRARLLELIMVDEIDGDAMEEVLNAMGESQIRLQRRLLEQLRAERAALPEDARELFDERLRRRFLSGAGCPNRTSNG